MVVSMQATTILDALGERAEVSRIMDKGIPRKMMSIFELLVSGFEFDHGSWNEIRLWNRFLMSAGNMA